MSGVCVTPYLSRCLLGVLVSAVRRLCVELPRVRFDYSVRYAAFLTPPHPCPAQNHCLCKEG